MCAIRWRRSASWSGALYLVDTVTSLGGIPVEVDNWHVDVCYSGTQKCLSCPPGLAPLSMSDKAMEKVHNRKTKVPNWYADLNLLTQYWGGAKRTYHHTAPINMVYALYQAIYNILDEGMENVFARHARVHQRLVDGLDKLGLKMLVEPAYRLGRSSRMKFSSALCATACCGSSTSRSVPAWARWRARWYGSV